MTAALQRWQEAEQRRDQLQAEHERLDAPEALLTFTRDEIDAERERLEAEIADADDEIEDAEIAFHRSEGDAEKVRELEMRPFERSAIMTDAMTPDEDED